MTQYRGTITDDSSTQLRSAVSLLYKHAGKLTHSAICRQQAPPKDALHSAYYRPAGSTDCPAGGTLALLH
jgi:hypothetical protein